MKAPPAWQSAEVDALYRLAAAGVRVPQPYSFHEGVLLMELVTDAHGDAAPRLNDVALTPEAARVNHAALTGRFARAAGPVDLGGVLREIGDAQAEERPRLVRMRQPLS